MQLADWPEFDEHFRRLCAGYNVPPTKHRLDAYFAGLARMSLAQFSRCVDDILGEGGPEDLPTVPVLWKTLRQREPSRGETTQASVSGVAPPSIQEQLMEYAAIKLQTRLKPLEYSAPWTYLYRSWTEDGKRCAECTGVVIDLPNGKRISFSVIAMMSDAEGHAMAMRHFKPGPRPTEAQVRAYAAIGSAGRGTERIDPP